MKKGLILLHDDTWVKYIGQGQIGLPQESADHFCVLTVGRAEATAASLVYSR